MTSAIRMSDNYYDNSGARPDKGGGGGLRGTPAVPLPLPAPSQPLMPSVAQGVSCSTGGDAHREGAPPGTSAPTPPTPPTTPSTPTPPTSPPLMPSVAQGVSFSTGGKLTGEGPLLQLLFPKLLVLQLLLHLHLLQLLQLIPHFFLWGTAQNHSFVWGEGTIGGSWLQAVLSLLENKLSGQL